jgi:deoxyribodipyrimidine photo-lyase
MANASVLWFRLDLRVADNPALQAALGRGEPVLPVFIWAPEEEGRWPPGAASRWWLHQSLRALDESLRERGSRLLVRRGPTLAALRQLLAESGATAVYWNRRYEPAVIARDRAVKAALQRDGCLAESSNAALLFEPWDVSTRQDRPYQVFTPFWNACLARPQPVAPVPAPDAVPPPPSWPASVPLAELSLEPAIDWAGGIRARWRPGEAGAAEELQRFLNEGLATYATARDRADCAGTSRLSPYLHFGEIGPRQVWAAVREARPVRAAENCYLRELGWREFAHHLLFHFPHTPEQPLREEFAAFPWESDPAHLRAWQRGRTGYPIVDAGLRELWQTGWMHNRVRMITASFLVKDLLISWRQGAAWFWDTLVDADLANNTLGWQWTAGCGADAAPYFRIFNPVRQGEKFDPHGDYVRLWVPELQRVPGAWLHRPWEAPAGVLAEAGVELGRTYLRPVVDHAAARGRARAALERLKDRMSV